jgi:hypothetical protein
VTLTVTVRAGAAIGHLGEIEQAPNNEIDNVGLLDQLTRMEIMMRLVLTAAIVAALFGCAPAYARGGGIGFRTPGIAATSRLGMTPGSRMAPAFPRLNSNRPNPPFSGRCSPTGPPGPNC